MQTYPDPHPSLCVILAGGQGRRMGGNKPLHPHDGGTLIGNVIERLLPQDADIAINAGAAEGGLAEALSRLGLPVLYDAEAWAGLGPLSGVCTALQFAVDRGHSEVITVPCDMPALPGDFVARLRDAGARNYDVVHFKGERDYPLCAIWNVRQLAHLRQALEAARVHGGLAVMKYLDTLRVRHVPVMDARDFININRPDGLA